ncbi:hypothetical protein NDU88_001821 [Pleurodeles waltl]|uniref:Uncharacterized protein n=1 Tax=Pleurodeles waltl TaxID=8319 RepID=A0AAV7NDN7_PLEWA|nr:hypothetical protein NDU88_001821 [Pleurodeles waltl]
MRSPCVSLQGPASKNHRQGAMMRGLASRMCRTAAELKTIEEVLQCNVLHYRTGSQRGLQRLALQCVGSGDTVHCAGPMLASGCVTVKEAARA